MKIYSPLLKPYMKKGRIMLESEHIFLNFNTINFHIFQSSETGTIFNILIIIIDINIFNNIIYFPCIV